MNQHTKDKSPWWTIALITRPCLIKVTRSIHILLMQSHRSRKHKRFITPKAKSHVRLMMCCFKSQKVLKLKCCWLKVKADRQRLIKVCLWCASDLFCYKSWNLLYKLIQSLSSEGCLELLSFPWFLGFFNCLCQLDWSDPNRCVKCLNVVR
jgi:hypothetical protein